MFSFTAVIWRFAPKLEYMQFPWRWLLCLSMIFVVFVTAGFKNWWLRGAVAVVGILVIAGGWHRFQAPWWDNAADLREMRDNITDHIGYEGTDEYTPVGADPSAINKDAPNVEVIGAAKAADNVGTIQISEWKAESKSFSAEMSSADELNLRLFRYPAWVVTVNGRVIEPKAGPAGQMLVPVGAGMNRVQVSFTRTWDRKVGGWISVLALWFVFLWAVLARRREPSVREAE
jgi:hypothetical protein